MKIKIDVSNGSDVFFISDLHLFHKNVIKYDKRPFTNESGEPDVDVMHQVIITNWNSVVSKKDTVFFLGDLAFGESDNVKDIIDQLNGTIHFVMGNHDKFSIIKGYNRFNTINDYVDLIIKSDTDATYTFALCHYPIHSWNKMRHGTFHIHGHSHHFLYTPEHSSYYETRRAMDVGCNGIDYTPISYKAAIDKLDKIVLV